jgi:hypothetical protein
MQNKFTLQYHAQDIQLEEERNRGQVLTLMQSPEGLATMERLGWTHQGAGPPAPRLLLENGAGGQYGHGSIGRVLDPDEGV